jgi:hypothetical protein
MAFGKAKPSAEKQKKERRRADGGPVSFALSCQHHGGVLCVSPNLAVVGLSFQLGERAGNIAHSPMLRDLAVTNAENIT